MTPQQQQHAAEALKRATSGQSLANHVPIIQGFMAKGIPADQISPRENVFTYNAWLALGRQVRKGEHGIKVFTYIVCAKKPDPQHPTENPQLYRRPWTTTVFHLSQTDPISEAKQCPSRPSTELHAA